MLRTLTRVCYRTIRWALFPALFFSAFPFAFAQSSDAVLVEPIPQVSVMIPYAVISDYPNGDKEVRLVIQNSGSLDHDIRYALLLKRIMPDKTSSSTEFVIYSSPKTYIGAGKMISATLPLDLPKSLNGNFSAVVIVGNAYDGTMYSQKDIGNLVLKSTTDTYNIIACTIGKNSFVNKKVVLDNGSNLGPIACEISHKSSPKQIPVVTFETKITQGSILGAEVLFATSSINVGDLPRINVGLVKNEGLPAGQYTVLISVADTVSFYKQYFIGEMIIETSPIPRVDSGVISPMFKKDENPKAGVFAHSAQYLFTRISIILIPAAVLLSVVILIYLLLNKRGKEKS